MEVCIIGSGFSGIASAKKCLDNNLIPVIFEKSCRIGGIWNCLPGNIGAWDSMHTNTFKAFMAFSDLPWPSNHADYPSRDQVHEYMQLYCQKHGLGQFIHFNSEVTQVSKSGNDYLVRWKQNGENNEKIFKYVVVASGKYAKETNPFPNSQSFQGTIIPGGRYRDPEVFSGKKVLSVGKSSTASDVALDALKTAASVTQVYRETSMCMHKYFKGIPYEFFYYRLAEMKVEANILPSLEKSSQSCNLLMSLTGNPGQILPEWEITEDYRNSNFVNLYILGDDYTSAVSSQQIKCVQGDVSHFYENGVVLSDGREVEAEVVLLGTGYSSDYSFLSEEILQVLQFDPNSRLLACVLFRSVFHPELPHLCFVGNYVFGVLARYEIEAELGFSFMLDRLDLEKEKIAQGLKDEEYIRSLKGLKQPYDHYNYVRDVASILHIQIDFDFIENELGFASGVMLPQFFFLDRPGMKDTAKEVVQELKTKFSGYKFN